MSKSKSRSAFKLNVICCENTHSHTRIRTYKRWMTCKVWACKDTNENEMERKETEKNAICFPRAIIGFAIAINYNYIQRQELCVCVRVVYTFQPNSTDSMFGAFGCAFCRFRIYANCCVNHCHEIFFPAIKNVRTFSSIAWYQNCLFSCGC